MQQCTVQLGTALKSDCLLLYRVVVCSWNCKLISLGQWPSGRYTSTKLLQINVDSNLSITSNVGLRIDILYSYVVIKTEHCSSL